MRWFRFYDEVLDDHKVQSLSPELFKAWVNLLCVASRNDGVLPSIDKLAFSLRVSAHEMQSRIDELVLAGLLDIRTDSKLEPHNWPNRQFTSDTSVERTRKYRERLKKKPCDVTVTAKVTPPESDTDTDTDTERDTPLPPKGAETVQKPLPKFGRLEALEAFNAYNAVALRLALPQAAKLTPNRERSIIARLRDYGLDGWHKAIGNIERSKFLTGRTEAGFRADLDFVCQAKSFGKLHDGGYCNGDSFQKPATPKSVFAHPPREREEDWKERMANEMWAQEQRELGNMQ